MQLDVALSRLIVARPRGAPRRRRGGHRARCSPALRTRAFIFNTLLHDKAIDDRLRSYPTWMSSRNLANEASDESVQALVEAVRARYDIPQRWYRLKARLLGIDRLADYDRMASVADGRRAAIGWDEARDLVLDASARSPRELGDARAALLRRALDRRAGAPGQARRRVLRLHRARACTPTCCSTGPAKRRDVLTLAHELGHGLHACAGATRGRLPAGHAADAGRDRLGVRRDDRRSRACSTRADAPESRLALLAETIEGSIATVFRQTAMNRFEDARAHRAPRRRASCRVERFGELWAAVAGGAARRRRRDHRRLPPGGPTSRTSSGRRATCTPTPTASCWPCRSTAATRSRATPSCPATSSCCPPAAR